METRHQLSGKNSEWHSEIALKPEPELADHFQGWVPRRQSYPLGNKNCFPFYCRANAEETEKFAVVGPLISRLSFVQEPLGFQIPVRAVRAGGGREPLPGPAVLTD